MVYISLPNSMHFEWAVKSLKAGKHVLCEKPFTSNGQEARELVEEGRRRNLVVEEAVCIVDPFSKQCINTMTAQFHWEFHPAAHVFRQILDSKQYGKIIRTDSWMTASPGVPDGDIRWQYDLGGGSTMDMTYALSFTRYAIHSGNLKKVISAVSRPYHKDSRVDAAMHALLLFEDPEGNQISSRVYIDMARNWMGGVIPRLWELPSIEVETENAIIYYYNAMMPHVYHYISITDKRTGKTEYKTQKSGGPLWGDTWTTGGKGGKPYWSTYRWQLEAFVDRVRGKEPPCWVSGEDSIAQMETIDEVYKAAGLPIRGEKSKEG